MHPTILALDASSTVIGWCVYDGQARDAGEIKLSGTDIAERCRQAHAALNLILATHPDVDAVAIESPVGRFVKAIIPQCRVSGALMACARLKGLHTIEVAPAEAKQALSGKGNADKHAMQRCALFHGVVGEHASDALGIALAAAPQVQVLA